MTPAERLTAAADLIEAVASEATQPWFAADQYWRPNVVTEGDAAWIALMGPDLAPHIEAILRKGVPDYEPLSPTVLALADGIIARGCVA